MHFVPEGGELENDSTRCPFSGAKSAVLGDALVSQVVFLEPTPEGYISLPVGSVRQGYRWVPEQGKKHIQKTSPRHLGLWCFWGMLPIG